MEQINNIDSEIIQGRYEFHDLVIFTSESDFFNIQDFSNKLSFVNCHFKGEINFSYLDNENFRLTFHKCTFDEDITISACDLDLIQFSFIKKIQNIFIFDSIFKKAMFNSNGQPIEGNLSIENTVIKESLSLNKLNVPRGELTLNIKNKIHDNHYVCNSNLNNSVFNILNFSFCDFGENVNFKNSIIKTKSLFLGCNFKKVSFNGTNFGIESQFKDCKFYSYAGFEECKNALNTNLKIASCLFTSFPHFNDSKFNSLEISHSTFEKKVSFDSININLIKLFQVTFMQGAYFDDIKINKLDVCERKTIRTIKQELQKAENKIDYNRFRAYELKAHYQELNWKENSKLTDKFILFTSKISTDFGRSWIKAFWFTVLSGIGFYLIFYLTENYNHTADFHNLENWTRFTSGLFRFFLVTDFFNPLETDRVYLINPLSWLIFIFGKIVIAFGIYEMIQSFRKFKA